jgi:hypothetical protein
MDTIRKSSNRFALRQGKLTFLQGCAEKFRSGSAKSRESKSRILCIPPVRLSVTSHHRFTHFFLFVQVDATNYSSIGQQFGIRSRKTLDTSSSRSLSASYTIFVVISGGTRKKFRNFSLRPITLEIPNFTAFSASPHSLKNY